LGGTTLWRVDEPHDWDDPIPGQGALANAAMFRDLLRLPGMGPVILKSAVTEDGFSYRASTRLPVEPTVFTVVWNDLRQPVEIVRNDSVFRRMLRYTHSGGSPANRVAYLRAGPIAGSPVHMVKLRIRAHGALPEAFRASPDNYWRHLSDRVEMVIRKNLRDGSFTRLEEGEWVAMRALESDSWLARSWRWLVVGVALMVLAGAAFVCFKKMGRGA
jgi:hypothetical protein